MDEIRLDNSTFGYRLIEIFPQSIVTEQVMFSYS